jgi:hypothetical protein
MHIHAVTTAGATTPITFTTVRFSGTATSTAHGIQLRSVKNNWKNFLVTSFCKGIRLPLRRNTAATVTLLSLSDYIQNNVSTFVTFIY